jgi:hypothetical protein
MMDMEPYLSILDGDRLLKKLIREDKETNRNLKDPQSFYDHSIGTSNLSYRVSCAFEHQGGDANIELTRVSALLHDIGKIVATPQEREKDPDLIFDSIYGVKYLEKMNLYKLGDIIEPSFTTYELIKLKPKLFPDIKLDDLIPKTPEQKIVVYADTHIAGSGRHVSFNERMRDMRERYVKNSLIVQSLDTGGEERLKSLKYEIEGVAGLLI